MSHHRVRRLPVDRVLGLVLGLVLTGLSACAAPATFTATDRSTISNLLEQQRAAWNRGDLDAFMAAYERSEQLIFTSSSQIRRGWQTTLDKYRARYGQDTSSMGKLAFEILDLRPIGADAAVMLGKWQLTETPQAGSGVFSLVFARTADGWRIVHDHTSAE